MKHTKKQFVVIATEILKEENCDLLHLKQTSQGRCGIVAFGNMIGIIHKMKRYKRRFNTFI